MATSIGGTTVYSDALWNNHLIGDFSSQGLPDPNQTLSSSLHNFVYDVYFYGADLEAAQSLEFDINQFVAGRSYIWGHECRVAGGHVWAVWDNPNNHWISTGIACNPASNSWNHMVIQVQRTSDNQLLYQTITLNGAGQLTFGGVLSNGANSIRTLTVNNGLGATATSARGGAWPAPGTRSVPQKKLSDFGGWGLGRPVTFATGW